MSRSCIQQAGINGCALAERGYRFVSADTRRHHVVALDVPWQPGFRLADWRLGGNCFARSDEEPHDVAGWVDFLVTQGAEQVVLVGHSLGVHWVTYYQAQQQDPRVVGVILASGANLAKPIDPARLKLAERLVAEGQEDSLLPAREDTQVMESADHIVSWQRVVGQLAAEGQAPWIPSIRVPVPATFGTVEDPVLHAALEKMRTRSV